MSFMRFRAFVCMGMFPPAGGGVADAAARVVRLGEVTNLDLLKAHRSLFEETIACIDAPGTCRIAQAEFERLIGRPLAKTDTQSADNKQE